MSDARLLEIAAYQHGYFTAAQAIAEGVSYRALTARRQRGAIERVEHGLYRLRHYPITPRDEMHAIGTLMPSAAFSHETALQIWGLSDVLPRTIHVTIPPASGIKPRPGMTIHRSVLDAADIVIRDDLRVTAVVRTLLDAARDGTDPGQLHAAWDEGRARGLFRQTDLDRLHRSRALRQLGA